MQSETSCYFIPILSIKMMDSFILERVTSLIYHSTSRIKQLNQSIKISISSFITIIIQNYQIGFIHHFQFNDWQDLENLLRINGTCLSTLADTWRLDLEQMTVPVIGAIASSVKLTATTTKKPTTTTIRYPVTCFCSVDYFWSAAICIEISVKIDSNSTKNNSAAFQKNISKE